MSDYEAVIGLEVHTELLTESKMFCSCSTKFGSKPNTQICPVCAGFPGTLPVMNKKAVYLALKTAIAFNCKPLATSRFARKNYFYPDLPKNYQISQYEQPLASEGFLSIGRKNIKLKRIHLEEDAGKLIHSQGKSGYSNIDLNRSGLPLIEIVTEPDIRTSAEAEKFLLTLKRTLEYLEVSDCNMEEGSLRCDANISVRKKGDEALGIKIEIKNMNSFKAVRKALDYETTRQISLLKQGKALKQETRLWNESRQITESMRSKEEAHDYRYFPDPDLVPIAIDNKDIETITAQIGELPLQRKERFSTEYELSEYDAEVLTSNKKMADFFEECAAKHPKPKILANWIMGDIAALLKSKKKSIENSPLTPEKLTGLICMIEQGVITDTAAKAVLNESFDTGKTPEDIIKAKKIVHIKDEETINQLIEKTLKENPQAIKDYKKGKEQAISYLMGQIMRETKGQANPGILKKNLLQYLKNCK